MDVAADVAAEVAEVAEPEDTEVAEVSSVIQIQMMLLKRKMMTKRAPKNQQMKMALLLPCLQQCAAAPVTQPSCGETIQK